MCNWQLMGKRPRHHEINRAAIRFRDSKTGSGFDEFFEFFMNANVFPSVFVSWGVLAWVLFAAVTKFPSVH